MRRSALCAAMLLGACAGGAQLHAAPLAAAASGRIAHCPRPLSHRGDFRTYPANTVPAFQEALKHGFPGVELDVHFSSDRVAIVSHDDWLVAATNCRGHIKTTSAADLARCTAYRTPLLPESGFLASRARIPAPVPRLSYALAILLTDPRARSVVVDIKPPIGPEGMIDALKAAIPGCPGSACQSIESRLTFISQNQSDAGRLRRAFPHAHIALESNKTVSGLIDEIPGDHWENPNIDTYSVSFNSLFDPKLMAVKLVRFENLNPKARFDRFYRTNLRLPRPRRLLGWTINSRAGIRGLHRYSFDEVLTDLSHKHFWRLWRETAPQGRRNSCGPPRRD